MIMDFFLLEYTEINFLGSTTIDIVADIYYKCTLCQSNYKNAECKSFFITPYD